MKLTISILEVIDGSMRTPEAIGRTLADSAFHRTEEFRGFIADLDRGLRSGTSDVRRLRMFFRTLEDHDRATVRRVFMSQSKLQAPEKERYAHLLFD